MSETLQPSLQQKLEERLRYYEDLGIRLFYRDRASTENGTHHPSSAPIEAPANPSTQEIALPKRIAEPPIKPAPRVEPVLASSTLGSKPAAWHAAITAA